MQTQSKAIMIKCSVSGVRSLSHKCQKINMVWVDFVDSRVLPTLSGLMEILPQMPN